MKKEFPEWAKTLYRGVRAGVSAGVAAILLLKIDLSDPQKAMQVVALVFVAGFIVAFGKWLRAWLDSKFGYDENSLVARIMPV